MKICIFGAGAIGGYLATHLAQNDGVDVSVIARGEHLEAIRRNGLVIESPRGDMRARVAASDNPADLGVQDFVIVALKSHQVTAALDGLGHCSVRTPPSCRRRPAFRIGISTR